MLFGLPIFVPLHSPFPPLRLTQIEGARCGQPVNMGGAEAVNDESSVIAHILTVDCA